jgi:hypothetical protein
VRELEGVISGAEVRGGPRVRVSGRGAVRRARSNETKGVGAPLLGRTAAPALRRTAAPVLRATRAEDPCRHPPDFAESVISP